MSRKYTSGPMMARFPATLGEPAALAGQSLLAELEATMGDGEAFDEIPFDPVPRLRKRRGGWSAERQRLFIALLRLCGSVSAAAKAVGMTSRGVYRLLKHEGAESFAEAWNVAFEEGLERTRASALERALTGALVPVYRRGKLVRVEHRYSDKLALGLLSGKDTNIDWYKQGAVRRYNTTWNSRPPPSATRRRSASRKSARGSIRKSWTGCLPRPRRYAPFPAAAWFRG